MTSDHDLMGMLRGLRKKLRRWHVSNETAEQQIFRWNRFEVLLLRCRERGLITDFGFKYLSARENVLSNNWGCRE